MGLNRMMMQKTQSRDGLEERRNGNGNGKKAMHRAESGESVDSSRAPKGSKVYRPSGQPGMKKLTSTDALNKLDKQKSFDGDGDAPTKMNKLEKQKTVSELEHIIAN